MAEILVADDTMDMLDLLVSVVEGSDPLHKIEKCNDGGEALAAIKKRQEAGETPFDGVLTDMEMPLATGVQVALAAISSGVRASCVAIATGVALPGNNPSKDTAIDAELRRARDAGVSLFQKPGDFMSDRFFEFLERFSQK